MVAALYLVGSGIASSALAFVSSHSQDFADLAGIGYLIIILAVVLVIYFAPAIAGYGTPRAFPMAVANLLLGWTLIGWVGVLIWALVEQANRKSTPPPLP